MVKLGHIKIKPLLNLIFGYSKPKLQAVKINFVLLLSADFCLCNDYIISALGETNRQIVFFAVSL